MKKGKKKEKRKESYAVSNSFGMHSSITDPADRINEQDTDRYRYSVALFPLFFLFSFLLFTELL